MATVKIGNVELVVPSAVAQEIEKACVEGEGKRRRKKEDIVKELQEVQKRFLELKKALTAEERERLEEELKEREKKYGYKAGRNAHLKKPKEYEDVPEDEFADPVGWNYPVNTKKRARAALAYFIRFHDAYDDVDAKIFIYERILRALKRFGVKRHFNPDFPLDWLVSDDLKEWMEGYEKYADEDTKTKRAEMRRKLSRMDKGEWLAKQLRAGTSHILTIAPQGNREIEGVSEEELPSALAEGVDALLSQIAEAAVEVLKDFVSELVEETKQVFQDTIKEVTSTIAEAVEDLADALSHAIKEIKGEEVGEEEEAPEELPPVEEGEAGVEGGVPAEGAPAAPPAPPEGGAEEERVPAPAPAPAPAATLAKSIGELLSDELAARTQQEKEESPLPYLRATAEYFQSLEGSELGKAIEIIRNALVKRYDVRITPQGVELEEEKKEEGK